MATQDVNAAFASNSIQDPKPTAWIRILKKKMKINYKY
jgi:hypothetical protein